MSSKIAAMALLAIVVGGALVYFILGKPGSHPDPQVVQLHTDVSSLRSDIFAIKAAVSLLASKQPEVRAAAQEQAIAAANAASVPAPTKKEFESKEPTPDTKAGDQKALDTAVDNLTQAEKKDPNAESKEPDCVALLAELKTDDKSTSVERLKDPATVATLQQCKNQLDEKAKQDRKDYNDLGCPAHPDTPECKKKQDEIKQDDTVGQIIKVILVIAAIYLIMDGDVATGLLLLSLANGGAGAGAGSGQGKGPEQTNGQPNTQVVGSTPPAVNTPVTQVATFPGTGGSLVCEIINNTLNCYNSNNRSNAVRIDPANTIVDLSADVARSNVAGYLAGAIKNKSGITFCAPRKDSTSNGVLDEIVLKHENDFFAITIAGKDYKLGIPGSGTAQNPCGN